VLTRLEADGFKNLLDFNVDFGPYSCIAGPNAAGKSNIFDAIEFLSLLADHSFMEAALRLRSAGPRGGDPRTLFWEDPLNDGPARMRLAAEMIVPSEVEDDFGRTVRPTTSFLRYELELQYEPPESASYAQMGRIVLTREELRHIKLGEASEHLPWPHSKKHFRDAVVFGRRSGTAYISTSNEDGVGIVNVHQDGGSRGQPRTSPANRAPRTVVSTTTTSDDPTILAVRREMQQWRTLALEPSAMRSPDAASESSQIAPSGAHLAAALYRLRSSGSRDVYAAVASAAAALTDVREVDVDFDPHRELLTLEAKLGSGPALPARALSDGTLRFLALCIIALDSEFGGLVCMEEPENGIHPGRVDAMVDLVRGLAVDPEEEPSSDNPFRQVIVNTHSPYFVRYQSADDLLLALPTSLRRGSSIATTVKLIPLEKTWRARLGGPTISKSAIMDYLRLPPGSQFELDFGDRVVNE